MRRRNMALTTVSAVLAFAALGQGMTVLGAAAASPTTGAVSTTTNPAVDNPNGTITLCRNGGAGANQPPGAINCNIYTSKSYVWLSGLPVQAALGAGTYFFAVLAPGGQHDPNDGAPSNLSDTTAAPWPAGRTNSDGSTVPSGDAYTNRTFSVDGSGTITYTGTHDFANNEIRLMPYDDTTNPGGVYILAVCSLASPDPSKEPLAPNVKPSDCKYDAFKIHAPAKKKPPFIPPTPTKTGQGGYTITYKWNIQKLVDRTFVEQLGGSAIFNYTVIVQHDGGTISHVKVLGTIDVFNGNEDTQGNIVPVQISGVADSLSDGTVCQVTNGGAQTLTTAHTTFDYECDLSALPTSSISNTAVVTWPAQTLSNGATTNGGSTNFTLNDIDFDNVVSIDECIDVNDTLAGHLGTVCVGDANPTTFTYSHSVPVPVNTCVHVTNTATFVTNDTGTTGSASQTVTVCGPSAGGALTMGFWQNKNGQGIITGQPSSGACPSAGWLTQFTPFQDLSPLATCSDVATYVLNVIKAATCSSTTNTCNTMLKAQMLATALDVYFSDPALGGNRINAPAPIGGDRVDLTAVGGSENASSAFGGATCLSVMNMLLFQNGVSNVGGSVWYGQVKTTQVLAKDAFDAVNNQQVFAC